MPALELLEAYLSRRNDADIELGFADLERIIGSPLPPVAERAQWWTDVTGPSNSDHQCQAWRRAGYDAFLLPGKRVLFTRRID